ncbi:MAG: hypothetical protein R6W76_11170, partial [Caldilinea sp.]
MRAEEPDGSGFVRGAMALAQEIEDVVVGRFERRDHKQQSACGQFAPNGAMTKDELYLGGDVESQAGVLGVHRPD